MNQPLFIEENVSLAPLTTLKIGGKARFFCAAQTEAEILQAVRWAKNNSVPLFVLGGGSNLLISDEGFDGLVLQICSKGTKFANQPENKVEVQVQAGEDWDGFVELCVAEKLQGIECLSGIPGTVGASPVQNIGAYGQEVSGTIAAVKCFDRETGELLTLSAAECGFAYRRSIFNTTHKNRFIILAVNFKLAKGNFSDSQYRDLQKYFGDKKADLAEMRRAVLEIRRAKSMVIDENDANSRSAGSFFKNPIVTKEKYAQITCRAESFGIENVPSFPADDLLVKIPAAWLIENSGFEKGFRDGNVGLSTKHTLALVNLGKASAADMLKLKDKIQAQVKKKFDVDLIPEPVFVGFAESEKRS